MKVDKPVAMKKHLQIFVSLFVALPSLLVSCGIDNGNAGNSFPHSMSVLVENEPPLDFEKDRLERDNAVIDRLLKIRVAQKVYRREHGRYAANFDELIAFLDESNYVDTLFHNHGDLQQMRYIPFSNDENGGPVEFFMQADSLHTRADFIQYLQGMDEHELNNYLLQVITKGTEWREVERVDTKDNPVIDANGVILKRRIPCREVGDITKNNNACDWPTR